ncbi:MAG TPA: ATP-dependent DNA helicase RecQ [Luteibaculaceae bacterium]|nr:ATP-dependent DNA helicase RecQ [Luteibaculaceae bacterium]
MFDYQAILKKYWGFDQFREKQLDIIRAVVEEQRDVLALLPTGGGKSICFQVPALAMPGMTLVISPLIALMNDQVDHLLAAGIPATSLGGKLSSQELDRRLDRCVDGKIKLLYISPERLLSDRFQPYLQHFKLSLIAVDEAHCISQWGYDFRPSYLNIKQIRVLHPKTPVVALTASATPRVQSDIAEKLGFKDHHVFQRTFYRPNLALFAVNTEKKYDYLWRVVQKNAGSGLVYTSSRKSTVLVSDWLQKANQSAAHYHAGLSPQERLQRQSDWITNKIRIMSCTNAFGMGIDKPDVRFVVHWQLPASLEAYYQEAGRGGRDGNLSYAVLLYNQADLRQLRAQLKEQFPSKDLIKKVYQRLGDYFQWAVGSGKGIYKPFYLEQFARYCGLGNKEVLHALEILRLDGWIDWSEPVVQPSRLQVLAGNRQLYEYQLGTPLHEPLIQTLLRGYTGIFDETVKIDEWAIAKRISSTPEWVRKQLRTLDKLGFVLYVEQSDEPVLALVTERLPISSIKISKTVYEERIKALGEQVEAMIGFVEHPGECRFVYLCKYFGEEDVSPCGKCDVCLQNKKYTHPEQVAEAVLQFIAESPATYESLLVSLQRKYAANDIENALDWLQGKGLIAKNEQLIQAVKDNKR